MTRGLGPVKAPEVSVVIPTLGRYDSLRRVLDGLAAQTLSSAALEVIVVADATESDLGSVDAAIGGRPFEVSRLVARRPGASAARNRGWQAARAPLILFIDDDILPDPHLVTEHVNWHRRDPDERVGVLGHVRWARGLRVTAFMRWLEHGMQFDYPAIKGVEAGWGRLYTANASLKAHLLRRAGGFDEERLPYLYEDLDLARRLSTDGFRLLYNRAAIGEHMHAVDLRSWRRRLPALAAAEREFVAKHPEVEPYFYELFSRAQAARPARGRLAPLVRVVPRRTPWLGERVWRSADAYFRQALAPAFLRAWEEGTAGRRPG